jgi:hypothetical protein
VAEQTPNAVPRQLLHPAEDVIFSTVKPYEVSRAVIRRFGAWTRPSAPTLVVTASVLGDTGAGFVQVG